jgi:hypothetical protein
VELASQYANVYTRAGVAPVEGLITGSDRFWVSIISETADSDVYSIEAHDSLAPSQQH